MKLFFCFFIIILVVQTKAFRVPLPYGTGFPTKGQSIDNQGIFHGILSWFRNDNNVQGNSMNKMSNFWIIWINIAYISEDKVSTNDEFLDGFDQFVQEVQKMEEPVTPLPIMQVLEDSLLKVKKELLYAMKHRHHPSPINSERPDFVKKHPSTVRMIGKWIGNELIQIELRWINKNL